jgi:ATP-dependent RNA helicase RhlB
MDFQRFGIDPRLAKAAEGLKISFYLYEKMLSHAVELQENVCAKISIDEGREVVFLLPALQWLLSGEARRVLVAVPDRDSAERCAKAVASLGSEAGIGTCIVDRASLAEGSPESPVFEGDPSAAVAIGRPGDLLAASGVLNLHDYGFLVVDGADRLGELPSDIIHKFAAALLPSWERRSLLACSKISAKAKNLARDLADNPSEISIEGEVVKAQSVDKETWSLPAESKVKFILGLIARESPQRICLFCNLKDTATEVARRLEANGLAADCLVGPLPVERKLILLEKTKSQDGSFLVLTDQGAEGLEPGVFPLVVNYDIPLEPEFFVKRLEMLDRSAPGAKVVSLACDRYIYGLPAVESYIDAKLEALPVDESLLSAEDKSAGMRFDQQQRRDANQRDAYPRQGGRRESGPRDSTPRGRGGQPRVDRQPSGRGSARRDESRRDANRFGDSPREGRSPDIRKSISEATGGALDMSGNAPMPSSPQRPEPQRGGSRRDGNRPQGGQGRQEKRGSPKRQDKAQGSGRGERGDQPKQRQQGPRPQGQRPPKPRQPSAAPAPQSGNPYDMSSEERMKRYREKYGHNLNEGGQGKGSSRGSAQPQSGGQKRSSGPSASPSKRPAQANPAAVPQPAKSIPRASDSLLGKLFGALKKKSE